jgi:hypothetical protein
MTLRGSTRDFPLESVIGLLAGTSKTGELQLRGAATVGALGFASGRLVAAVMDGEAGEDALGAIFAMSEADFEFTPWASPPEANLESGDLLAVLKRAAQARDRLVEVRESIPDDRIRFRLSEKAADQGAVTFTPERWRALLAVNGERDVPGIAEQLRLGKMPTLTLLAGLVKDGVIETLPPAETGSRAPARPREATPPQASSAPAHPPPAEEVAPPTAEPEHSGPPADTSAAAESAPASSSEPTPRWEASAPEPESSQTSPAATDWSTPAPEPPRAEPITAPTTDVRGDLEAELSARLGGFGPDARENPPAPAAQVPPAVDDRLSALTSLFSPGPAANVPPSRENDQDAGARQGPSMPPPARSADSWMPPPPASSEAPANTWAPSAAAPQAPASTAPSGVPTSSRPEAPPAPSRTEEWGTAPGAAAPRTEAAESSMAPQPADASAEKKRGFFGRFRREEPTSAQVTPINVASARSRSGLLASLSNTLLMEYNSGAYGKGKIETRLANLLMRVDEQADPIDRPLPVVDDLIDAAALEREGLAEDQVVPYLATLVREIYEEAERTFGKDKAKKGYKAAQQQVFGGDASVLQSPDLAGKLPKA